MRFWIDFNDITNVVNSSIRLFADDTTIYIQVEDAASATDTLNLDLQEMESWSHRWLVSFNPSKTKSMIISKKRIPLHYPDLNFMGETIENENEHKHLGLIMRSDLTWSSHINSLATKGTKMVNIMKHLQYRLSRHSLEIIYFAFIRPILEYGSVVWDGCSLQESQQLEGASCVITGATRYTSHALIYEESGLEKLSERRKKSKLILFYKIMHVMAPQYLRKLVPSTVSERNRYNVRSRHNLSNIRTRTNLFNNSFFPSFH